MSSQLSSVPGGGNILIIPIAGIRVLVCDRKKEAGEHTTSTTPPGFSIRSCILRTIFGTDAALSHLKPSLINLKWFLVMQAPRVVFVTGRGGAGFHSPDPALTRGRGGMFRVIPALPPSGAHPHSFPGRGPVCYHLFLTGTRLGYGWGGGLSGDRGRECRKRHPAPGR